MDCCSKKRLLTIMTSVCACAAFGLLCIAVATDYWLYTRERLKKDSEYNTTIPATYRSVYSGLWRKCEDKGYSQRGVTCSYIKYFTGDEDREGLGPTEAILLNIRRATMFPLVSLLILLIGGIMCFIGHCNSGRKILTFVCGILFVLAGLCTLVGIILYIGSITEEVGNKPRASIEEPKFVYYYGSSFIMAVGSFILTELSGVFSVYLYITKNKQAQRKKLYKIKHTENAHKTEANDNRANHWRHSGPRSQSRERSQSRDRSRDPSVTRSDSYFTYTPISDASHELSNYNFQRDSSRNTISTTAEMHPTQKEIVSPPPSIDIVRRTTPV
ncbi:voltage-dependent calcium channel gamma-5 subunit-like [Gigantopelta aegis]|uniref:voltage-dependent calcium channel gamma-5 subunit-like n=1 Tax=Gigantopelta aegis TaxID=1735272 RepID=UPI001B88DD34|nr:voltage-dependent calcium channel gamma-5 subunit-like [Gigantopelta aegis]